MERLLLIFCLLFIPISSLWGQVTITVNTDGPKDFKEQSFYYQTILPKSNPIINCTKHEIKCVNGETIKIWMNNLSIESDTILLTVLQDTILTLKYRTKSKDLNAVIINNTSSNERISLKGIEGTTIYAGKKNEIVSVKDITANTSTNNARQILAKITGLTIWDSDGGGLQLSIGGRGLNPNRISNFNTRQNGYDISADALGYPESYYTPPAEALDRIEILRGAASLQFGTQFGGLINFKFKDPSAKKLEVTARNTIGSYGFYNTFTSFSGTIKKFSYSTFYQFKQGDGWRTHSAFNYHNYFGQLNYNLSEKVSFNFEFTKMNYLAQQPGGLTDNQFSTNPYLVLRKRNWFRVNWNLAAAKINAQITPDLKLKSQFFFLKANRDALGILSQINRADPLTERDLWMDAYLNSGNETRLVYTYFLKGLPQNLAGGFRLYNGFTLRQQGLGNKDSTGKTSDFYYPEQLKNRNYSEFEFPSFNTAVFLENIVLISPKLKLIPGIRQEFIKTEAQGYFLNTATDLAGNILFSEKVTDTKSSARKVFIAGIGSSYTPLNNLEIIANITQNYRSINFNDFRIVNPNLKVDPNLKDERGYSADAGIKGEIKEWYSFDLNLFYMRYQNRIGTILQVDSNTYQIYRYRTNISESYSTGIEIFEEINITTLLKLTKLWPKLTLFNNTTFMDARYVKASNPSLENKKVEYAPPLSIKNGMGLQIGQFRFTAQHTYVSAHFSDASNATFTSNAINGSIPKYQIWDLSLRYQYKWIRLEGSINNLFNTSYFSRRAEGYPGPGIIPSDPRTFYLTLQIKL